MLPDPHIYTGQGAGWKGAGQDPKISRVYDCEDGPKAIRDTSGGMAYQRWRIWIEQGRIYLDADNQPRTLLREGVGITDVSLAFNQNADLHYTWVEEDICYLLYFDSLTNSTQVMTIGKVYTPKITLDDKRQTQTQISDVILTYIKDGYVYYRYQRDRFEVEYKASEETFTAINRFYMNKEYCLQWELTR